MKSRSGYRKIVVDGISWQYKITKRGICAYCEDGRKKIQRRFDCISVDYNDGSGDDPIIYSTITPNYIRSWLLKTD